MSSRSYIVKGYGFTLEDVSEDTRKDFIRKHYKSVVDIADEITSDMDEEEIEEEIEEILDDNPDEIGKYIAEIITTETFIPVNYEEGQSDCYGSESILLYEGMPWDFKNIRNLTEEKLQNILRPYSEELGAGQPEPVEIEYFG